MFFQANDKKYENMTLMQKLRESESKYRDLFENAGDAIYIYNVMGYFMEANTTALDIIGCRKEELIGTHISEWITPESLNVTQENLKKGISGELEMQPMTLEVIRKNGEHRLMEIKRRLVRDGDKVVAVHGIGRDITEKRKMEMELEQYHEKLKESEAKYRELFENAQDAMYVLDADGTILEMNHAGLQILGCTKEEARGNNISKWLTPQSARMAQNLREKLLRGEILDKSKILEIVCNNKEHRWVEIKIRKIKGQKATEIHGIARDVTENMILKQELKKSNKQRKLLCYLIEGTRGGKTRAIILSILAGKPSNAHQLAKTLGIDYKTVRHHLDVLGKNGIIAKGNNGYSAIYFLSKKMELNLDELNRDKSI